GQVDEGTVANTTAVNSHVTTLGEGAFAGIGGGIVTGWQGSKGTVANTTAVNSYVDGTEVNIGSIANDQLLCQKADPRVLTANCSSRTEFLDALDLSYSDSCPVNTATSIADGSKPIKINDAETLGKIGKDPRYPLDGTYQQTADIVVTQDYQSIGDVTHPFTGKYDGQCRTISGLSDCFVDTLEGSISDLHFTRANITNSRKATGLAACVVDVNGTVSNIRAENVHIVTSGEDAYAGIGGGAGFRNGCQH
ncbi:hypothetical protein J7438_26425, partial [Thalassotalea sp. G20_0]|uniref:hypothetical protein n=1 Tax=Thalassotalea sp. G20_0 TaxID=2821093 RepID=UPI001ADAA8F6